MPGLAGWLGPGAQLPPPPAAQVGVAPAGCVAVALGVIGVPGVDVLQGGCENINIIPLVVAPPDPLHVYCVNSVVSL